MTLNTRETLLQKAEILIRTRGYSAFSFADLAEHTQMTKASVHYHFPSKEDLMVTLFDGYMERFITVLAQIKAQHIGPRDRLEAYADLFLDGFEQGMLPLCGALSAERSALPASMLPKVEYIFQVHIDWLNALLTEAVAEGYLRGDLSVEDTTMLILSTLEGGSFVGWALARTAPVLAAFRTVLTCIGL